MYINNIKNNISFQKQQLANCSVVHSNGKKLPCTIYKISPDEDKDYFEKASGNYIWENSEYLPYIIPELRDIKRHPECSVYSIEDGEGRCLGFTEVSDYPDKYSIDVLETAPRYVNSNSKSPIKYIGETLISFVTKMAQDNRKPKVIVYSSNSAQDFYAKHMHMRHHNTIGYYYMPSECYSGMLLQNEEHTGSSIDFLS